jgi:K+ transporter
MQLLRSPFHHTLSRLGVSTKRKKGLGPCGGSRRLSVLSAIEGIKVYAPQAEHVIVPLTAAILVLLFVVQRKGTSFTGGIFGPVMLVWSGGAYGIAVSLLMMITTLMATFVALHWKHNRLIVYTVNSSLLAVDLAFFASTCTKFVDGGWFPVLIALAIAFIMLTRRRGEEMMDKIRLEVRFRSKDLLERLKADPPLLG